MAEPKELVRVRELTILEELIEVGNFNILKLADRLKCSACKEIVCEKYV